VVDDDSANELSVSLAVKDDVQILFFRFPYLGSSRDYFETPRWLALAWHYSTPLRLFANL
jgi:hypothetical protein